MKYYAVKQGRNIGVYETWEECKTQVEGYTNAVYKSFSSKADAEAFIKGVQTLSKPKQKIKIEENAAVAYSDGSFIKHNNTYSYGAVVMWQNKEFHFSKRYRDDELKSMWNVSGELQGAKRVMLFAYANNIKKLYLYHDYEGIAKWANHEWKAKSDEGKEYIKFVDQIRTKVELEFIWVKGHSNDYYNDLADQLAANATFEEYVKEV
ncbi:Ribonuclease HI-related protein [Mesoplasma florum W37]|uniref:ribonuclease H n=1 Tax=Mesoplasma florum TaxID=2151 RepID=A0AAD0HS58_MESFO|nr:ribonuclease H family protein [Mesoplasma florum]AGY41573.1 Ribonuclease HI-related protein [Mesoplasma florum W37]AVN59784.1 RNase H [Mesoplasma florum]AVN65911.1 Ribonuclease HI-related protein [Mesoplasma florum]